MTRASVIEYAELVLDRLDGYVRRMAHWCVCASAVGIFFIVGLLAVSSTKRYLFDAPIHMTEELGGLMFMATTFLAITQGFVQERHVRLELLWRYLRYPWRQLLEVAGYALVLVALPVLVYQTWGAAMLSYELGAHSVMADLLMWPWRLVMPLTLGLFTCAVALRMVRVAVALARGRSDAGATVQPEADHPGGG